MTLGDLLDRVRAIAAARDGGAEPAAARRAQRVKGIAHDSRHVGPGWVFVAVRGERADGVAFAPQAIADGAIAVVAGSAPSQPVAVPWIVADDPRRVLAGLAADFYGRPTEELTVVGITGTNGKTTTSYLLTAIFERAGVRCGRLGTVSYRIGAEERDAARTTPEAPDVQRLLREMVDAGCGACAMEVSSHALTLRRVDFTRFAAGVFTNLTRDHLDFHGDMERYFQAKRRLFEMLPEGAVGVINADDPRGDALVPAVARPVTYAIQKPADVRPESMSLGLDGLSLDVRTPRGPLSLRSRLVGRPNAYNILAASATAVALDLPDGAIERGVADLEDVPGRFQVVSGPADGITVVVDYAHTDDALKNLLETARAVSPGRLITVFGCGGDRDRTKRPLMGAVAARLSDLVVVTSDNPRSEDPEEIIDEIKRGLVPPADRLQMRNGKAVPARGTPHLAIVDRRDAIDRAIREAQPGDVVLLAGKGHEKYQVIGDRALPFDDVEVAREALAKRRAGSRVS